MNSLRPRANPSNGQYIEFRDESGRAVSPEELSTLILATWDGPVRFGMTGPERSMLYRLASELRLTVEELRRLTPASFRFGETTTVRVAVDDGGGRHTQRLTLRSETARDLGSFLVVPEPDQPIFRIPKELPEMLRADVQAACENMPSKKHTLDADVGRASTKQLKDKQA